MQKVNSNQEGRIFLACTAGGKSVMDLNCSREGLGRYQEKLLIIKLNHCKQLPREMMEFLLLEAF